MTKNIQGATVLVGTLTTISIVGFTDENSDGTYDVQLCTFDGYNTESGDPEPNNMVFVKVEATDVPDDNTDVYEVRSEAGTVIGYIAPTRVMLG